MIRACKKCNGCHDSWHTPLDVRVFQNKFMETIKIQSVILVVLLMGCNPISAPISTPAQRESTSTFTPNATNTFQSTDTPEPSPTSTPTTLPENASSEIKKVSVEEYALKGPPEVESRNFIPIEGTQKEILAKHQEERNKTPPRSLLSLYESSHYGFWATLKGQKITATLYEIPFVITDQRKIYDRHFSDSYVQVAQGEKVLYTVQTGKVTPRDSLIGLWTYDDHWALEVVRVKGFDFWGEIVVDGLSLNEQQGHQETFGFQLIEGKPFYFYKQMGKTGIFYNGHSMAVEYDEVPHYGCCSAGGHNPIHSESMVSFFARRSGTWYYVEIGAFKR